jgi:hypothetical protein
VNVVRLENWKNIMDFDVKSLRLSRFSGKIEYSFTIPLLRLHVSVDSNLEMSMEYV